ncbi:hypothetical protein GCM10027174_25340 [Salinifilum aidingensis]
MKEDKSPACLVVAWRDRKKATGRLVKSGGEVVELLRGYAEATLQKIEEGNGRTYDPNGEKDDEVYYLTTDREEVFDSDLLDEIWKGDSLPVVSQGELKRQSFVLYALIIGDDLDNRYMFIRRVNPVKLATKSIVTRWFDETLDRVEDPILSFDNNFDVVFTPNSINILDQNKFEDIFRDSEAVLEQAQKWADDIADELPVELEGVEYLKRRIRENSSYRRRAYSIRNGSNLKYLTIEILKKSALENGLDPNEIIKDGRLVFSKEHEKTLLALLNEDLWVGDFSGDQYSATRKTKR